MSNQPRTIRVDSTGRKFVLYSGTRQGPPGPPGATNVAGVQDEFIATVGQGVFPLSAPPKGSVTWSLNGVTQKTSEAVVAGQALHLSGPDAAGIEDGDVVTVSYIT